MTQPTPPEAALEALDGLQQIAELAAGYRARLEALGFSPTAAETIASHMLIGLQSSYFGGAR